MVGVGLVEDDEGRTFFARTFAATLSYNPTASLSLFVDVGLQSPEKRAGRAAVILDAGLGYLLTPQCATGLQRGQGRAREHVPAGLCVGRGQHQILRAAASVLQR